LLNVRETARRLGVHENTVRNWSRQGLLPEARVPGSRFHRFRLSDVERLLTQRGAPAPSLQTERRAVNPELVSANQLKQWPDVRGRDAQETFPELMRRLLIETPGISAVSIRSGEGVASAGWDGAADSEGTDFLPAGQLAFEFGVNKDAKRKATKDYNDRVTHGPSGKVFVFATPRRWPAGPAWADERRAEGHFADVRVVDADVLEGWLRASPGAHHWVSEHLGLRPRDAESIDTWWSRFSASTDPALPPALFLAGRSTEADRLIQRLGDTPQVTIVQSESTPDGLGFMYASLYGRGEEAAEWTGLPAMIVKAPEVWDRILERRGRLILVPQFAGADVGAALDGGYHVISIVDRTTVSRRVPDLALPRLDRRAAGDAFRADGVDFKRADRLAALGRRSLPALVRKLSRNPAFERPSWARQPDASVLGPLALVGAWTTSEEDTAAVEQLTGQAYDVIDKAVRRVSTSGDPVLRQVGSTWALAGPEEAFLLLAESLTSQAVRRWSTQAGKVLLEPDPMLDLPRDERMAAQLKGVRRRYSTTLRRGLAQGLALMGAMGSTITLDDGITLAEVAAQDVRDLLDEANRDPSGRRWHHLTDVLPLLAEAAPEAFLAAVEDDLLSKEPVLVTLFQEEDGDLFGASSPHPQLLWALETACWSEQYLIDGVRVLAHLAARDPGGKSGSRPRGSLGNLLCGWIRNTAAPLDVRLQAIDAAYTVSETVGWQLIFDLWPGGRNLIMPPAAPRFRDWRPTASRIPMAERVAFVDALVTRAISRAGVVPERVAQLIQGLPAVLPADRDRIIDFLQDQVVGRLDDDGRLYVWEKLQSLIARHERFAEMAWAMTADVRARLETLAAYLEPQNDPQRFANLFEWRPDLPGIDHGDFATYDAKLAELRQEAVRTILDSPQPFDHLARLALRIKAPSQLGVTLAMHDEVGLSEMFPWLAVEEPALREAAAVWAQCRMMRSGASWLAEMLEHPELKAVARQTIIRSIPASKEFWQALHDSQNADDDRDYWATTPIRMVPVEDSAEAVRRLVDRDRAWSAISVASYALYQSRSRHETECTPPLSQTDIIDLLDRALGQVPADHDDQQMMGHYVGTLLDHLTTTNAPDGEVARFEYAYFRLLEHDRPPATLNRILATQPEMFVGLVKRAYRGKAEPRREMAGADEDLATQAWWVLNGWEGFPGREDDGSVNQTTMNDWVRAARLELSDVDRADIGDELIGQTFAHCPVGTDGIWPAEPVRDLIETVGSREIESGVIIGRRNSRGVTRRGVYDGGQQERDLAQRYRDWSNTVRGEWPRTARILRTLADSYEQEARREDLEAELDADRE
jgi:excisionase family DNA binding protein